jgi:carboxyl-terminal processing protease
VYSFIVEANKRRYGYVKIPSFMLTLKEIVASAEDTAMEVKLQKDSIQGVIIDLMDNGGGSMDEAMKLAGMFIDSGPISVILIKKVQTIINDPYPGMIYKDPIVILINGIRLQQASFCFCIARLQ